MNSIANNSVLVALFSALFSSSSEGLALPAYCVTVTSAPSQCVLRCCFAVATDIAAHQLEK